MICIKIRKRSREAEKEGEELEAGERREKDSKWITLASNDCL